MQSGKHLFWWSWVDIVKHAHQLGIPHFQRGAVWDLANRTALLESMFERSPCGSFVLWQPLDNGNPQRHGVPVELNSFGQGVEPMWLVDGQQRTRAMLDTYRQLLSVPQADGWSLVRNEDIESLRAFDPHESADTPSIGVPDDDEDDDDDEGQVVDTRDSKYWGVFLPAIRQFDVDGGSYFADRSESSGVQRGAIFGRFTPTARKRRDAQGKAKRVPPGKPCRLPLALLLAPTSIFGDVERRRYAARLLQDFWDEGSDYATLDMLLPWGPQFVTGHAYKLIENGKSLPMMWADVRRERVHEFTVSRLVGLLGDDKWSHVFAQLRDMLTGERFAVGELPISDVSAAIDAYVRINRAGIRVRQEEQALALLSRAHPGLLDELAEFIRVRDGEVSTRDGRSLLVHESDRHMGFAVWMGAVTRYSALALLGTTACGWLGTAAVEKSTFGDRLGRIGPEEKEAGTKTWARKDYSDPQDLVQECSARATRALTLVDSVMSKELGFDHRMARPSTRALTPLIDLLYRVPEPAFDELDEDFRAAISRLLHWALLAPYLDQAEMRSLIKSIHGLEDIREGKLISPWSLQGDEWCRELRLALGRYQATLLEFWRRSDASSSEGGGERLITSMGDSSRDFTELSVRAFRENVRKSHSLQRSAVGWLYAIERRAGAREFRWEAQYEGYDQSGGKWGIKKPACPHRTAEPLKRTSGHEQQLYPEKQHIVPFRHAKRIADKGGTRATASKANAIGNLTWLSQRQNGLDGLKDRWTVMDIDRDYDNLVARGMLWRASLDEGSPTAIELYEKIRDAGVNRNTSAVKEMFDEFCRIRGDWMVYKMREWLEEPLPEGAKWWLGGS